MWQYEILKKHENLQNLTFHFTITIETRRLQFIPVIELSYMYNLVKKSLQSDQHEKRYISFSFEVDRRSKSSKIKVSIFLVLQYLAKSHLCQLQRIHYSTFWWRIHWSLINTIWDIWVWNLYYWGLKFERLATPLKRYRRVFVYKKRIKRRKKNSEEY